MAPSISFPPAAANEILDGSNWLIWSLCILALLQMNGLWKHITEDTHSADDKDWDAAEEMLLGILEMYTQKDIWTTVVDDTRFTSCKHKWDELK